LTGRVRTGASDSRAVVMWLVVCCAMVFAMVVLGGVTRLTESGLSIVDWRPVTGALPPLSEAAWRELFQAYRDSPEFRTSNFWMTLADFKAIYWFEYLHRLWGRAIGIVFFVPFVYFLLRRRLDRALTGRLVFAFVLGGAQGLLGWYMVKSGLVDRPAVSQYRLAAHLALAVAIYGYLMWLALDLARAGVSGGAAARLRPLCWTVLGWTSVTVITGAFVAGIDAGLAYNTFPLMDGGLAPSGMFTIDPWPLNFFENAATVQFTHRVVAISLVVLILALWFRARAARLVGSDRRAIDLLAAWSLVQAGLGIATLLSEVQIAIAAAHQAGAMILFTLAVWTAHGARRSSAA